MASSIGDALGTAAISVATTLITFYLTTRWKKKQDKGEAKDQELSERLNPDVNIRREYQRSHSVVGFLKSQIWIVNPHWIEFNGVCPALREWTAFTLHQEKYETTPDKDIRTVRIMLKKETVDRAIERREWMKFHEESGNVLDFFDTVPASAEDRYLFQPLPKAIRRR